LNFGQTGFGRGRNTGEPGGVIRLALFLQADREKTLAMGKRSRKILFVYLEILE